MADARTMPDDLTPASGLMVPRCSLHRELLDDHEGRIRFLERSHYRQAALVSAFAAAASLLGAYWGSAREPQQTSPAARAADVTPKGDK